MESFKYFIMWLLLAQLQPVQLFYSLHSHILLVTYMESKKSSNQQPYRIPLQRAPNSNTLGL